MSVANIKRLDEVPSKKYINQVQDASVESQRYLRAQLQKDGSVNSMIPVRIGPTESLPDIRRAGSKLDSIKREYGGSVFDHGFSNAQEPTRRRIQFEPTPREQAAMKSREYRQIHASFDSNMGTHRPENLVDITRARNGNADLFNTETVSREPI